MIKLRINITIIVVVIIISKNILKIIIAIETKLEFCFKI